MASPGKSLGTAGGVSVGAAVAPMRPAQGQWQVAWGQFKKHRIARVGLVILGFLYFMALIADFVAPYSEPFIDVRMSYAPPTRVHFFDADGRLTRPFIYPLRRQLDLQTFQTIWTADTTRPTPIRFFVQGNSYRFASVIPMNFKLFGVGEGTRMYLWGADKLGQDLFGKIWYGARISLSIGILAALVSVSIALFMGGLAGFYGGIVDTFIMRLVEVLAAIPGLFLLITLSAVFRPLNLSSGQLFAVIVVALSIISWGGLARVIRGLVLKLREEEFSQAAKALGASDVRVIARHILPQTASWVVVSMSLTIPGLISAESALSFIGVGVQSPATSWGLLLAQAQTDAGISGIVSRPWVFIPGIFIFVAILSWNLVGDGVRDALDPRSRK
jgi:peptide/nickel transport system permease protein